MRSRVSSARQQWLIWKTRWARAISAPPGLRDKTVFDRQSDYYLILREGWDGSRRIHGPVVSLEIIDGKVWLQADNTDLRVAERLEEAGIPKADIALGFQPQRIAYGRAERGASPEFARACRR